MSSTVLPSTHFAGSKEESRPRGPRWGLLGVLVSLIWAAAFGILTVRQWQNLGRSERFLDESLVSKEAADYSAKRPAVPIGRVRLTVIEDMVRDSQPEAADLKIRLASIPVILNSVIPGANPPPEAPVPAASAPESGRTILYFDDPIPEKAAAVPSKTKASDALGKANPQSQASSPAPSQPSTPGVAPAPTPVPAEPSQPVAPVATKPPKKAWWNHPGKAKVDHPGNARPDKPGQVKPAPSSKGHPSGFGGSRGQNSGNSKGKR
jgi:hypothetical protein